MTAREDIRRWKLPREDIRRLITSCSAPGPRRTSPAAWLIVPSRSRQVVSSEMWDEVKNGSQGQDQRRREDATRCLSCSGKKTTHSSSSAPFLFSRPHPPVEGRCHPCAVQRIAYAGLERSGTRPRWPASDVRLGKKTWRWELGDKTLHLPGPHDHSIDSPAHMTKHVHEGKAHQLKSCDRVPHRLRTQNRGCPLWSVKLTYLQYNSV